MKMLACRDIGVECDVVIHGKNELEVLRKATKHAKEAHGMTEISRELKREIREAIQEEEAA